MSETSTKFHFSPRPNRAHEIEWREWGPEAFEEAREAGKPLLLSLSAVWCHWCHVMDETSYSDEGVISYINKHYIPVRVDNDQRPDVNARYNMGGWPTTAFLTPEGEALAGSTYVPPDQMKELLPKVWTYYQSNRDEVAQKVAELKEKRRELMAAGTREKLTEAAYEQVVRMTGEMYDPMYGGFGEAPKFPHTDAIDLLLYHHRKTGDPDVLHMARKTLESMCSGEVYDHEWNGFFRYSTRRDWSEPHYEKMLEDNAGLLRNLLALYRASGNEEHASYASRTIEYVEWKLREPDNGYFYGSQDADEEFYKRPKEDRENYDEPYIDRTGYTSWNAMMISAYLEASWTLERPELRDEALKALAYLWDRLREGGNGMFRFDDGSGPQIQGLLGDQAHTARALLDAYEVTGDRKWFERAVELATFMRERFYDPEGGGFFDVWDKAPEVGRVHERDKSQGDNAVCADVFLRLSRLTRDESYKDVARATLEAFAGGVPRMGHFAAGLARQIDTFLNPPAEVNIVGNLPAADVLHLAALRLDTPSRVVQVIRPGDSETLERLMLPAEPAPAAYACFGMMCSPPVTEPEELADSVRHMAEAAAAT